MSFFGKTWALYVWYGRALFFSLVVIMYFEYESWTKQGHWDINKDKKWIFVLLRLFVSNQNVPLVSGILFLLMMNFSDVYNPPELEPAYPCWAPINRHSLDAISFCCAHRSKLVTNKEKIKSEFLEFVLFFIISWLETGLIQIRFDNCSHTAHSFKNRFKNRSLTFISNF